MAYSPPADKAIARGTAHSWPVMAAAAPNTIGNAELKKPASGKPVCGLTVSDPPLLSASFCIAFSSLVVI